MLFVFEREEIIVGKVENPGHHDFLKDFSNEKTVNWYRVVLTLSSICAHF